MDNSNPIRNEGKKENLISRIKFFWRCAFFSDHKTLLLLWAALFLDIANWLILWIWIEPVDLPIVLHYNVYFGVDVLGSWKQVFFSPILGIFFLLINGTLACFFYNNKEKIASYIMLIGLFFIELSLIVYSVSLVIINY